MSDGRTWYIGHKKYWTRDEYGQKKLVIENTALDAVFAWDAGQALALMEYRNPFECGEEIQPFYARNKNEEQAAKIINDQVNQRIVDFEKFMRLTGTSVFSDRLREHGPRHEADGDAR